MIMTYQWKFQTFLQSSKMVFASFWVGYIAAYKLWRFCFHSGVPTAVKVIPQQRYSRFYFPFFFQLQKSVFVPDALSPCSKKIQDNLTTNYNLLFY